MDIKKDFCDRIKELILLSEKDIKLISKEMGIQDCDLYHWTSGLYYPSLKSCLKLSEYFSCTIDYLMGLTDSNFDVVVTRKIALSSGFNKVLKQFGTNIYKISKSTGVGRDTMYKWLKDKTELQIEPFVLVAKHLGCTIESIIGRE